MFEFFAASVLPMLTNVLHNLLTAAVGVLIAWAIGRMFAAVMCYLAGYIDGRNS